MDNTKRALAAAVLTVVVLATGAAQAVAAQAPETLLPGSSDPLVNADLAVEGPLINNVGLPKIV
jgi:hypothetical protein